MSQELWVFKHAPRSLNEMIVSPEKKRLLERIIKEIPNTLIAGKAGTGKGTFMNILLNETGCNYLKINGSMETSIDVMREKVVEFSKSYDPTNKKIVYINEMDRLSPNAVDSLKDLLEEVQHITRFFFLSNDEYLKNDKDNAIKSRCSFQLNLNDPPGDIIFKKCIEILKKENVKLKNTSELINLVKKCYPDIRKIIGTLQSNVSNGVLDTISYSTDQDLYKSIFSLMKSQEIDELRKKLKSNYINYDDLFEYIYREVMEDPDLVNNPGEFMIMIGEYLYKNSIVAIKEINFISFVFNLMKKGVL